MPLAAFWQFCLETLQTILYYQRSTVFLGKCGLHIHMKRGDCLFFSLASKLPSFSCQISTEQLTAELLNFNLTVPVSEGTSFQGKNFNLYSSVYYVSQMISSLQRAAYLRLGLLSILLFLLGLKNVIYQFSDPTKGKPPV